MSDFLDRPVLLLTLLVLLGAGYGIWTFTVHTRSADPHWQKYVRSEGFPPHRLNLWSDPHPPSPGTTVFQVEYDFVELMNRKVGQVEVRLHPVGSPDATLRPDVEFVSSGPEEGRYRTEVQIPKPGDWILEVRANWKGNRSSTTFELSVSPD